MADFSGFGSQSEGNNFDDFEKLDPLASGGSDEFNVSSSNIPSNPLDEDLYTATPAAAAMDPAPSAPAPSSQPLLDFGEGTKPAEPAIDLDALSAKAKEISPVAKGSGSTGGCACVRARARACVCVCVCVCVRMQNFRVAQCPSGTQQNLARFERFLTCQLVF